MTRDINKRPAPTGEVSSYQDDWQRIVRQFFGDADASLAGAFSPALDVEETDNDFTLHVEIPGVKPDEVDVSIEENVLTSQAPDTEEKAREFVEKGAEVYAKA